MIHSEVRNGGSVSRNAIPTPPLLLCGSHPGSSQTGNSFSQPILWSYSLFISRYALNILFWVILFHSLVFYWCFVGSLFSFYILRLMVNQYNILLRFCFVLLSPAGNSFLYGHY
jgi:hypothetical protein